MPYKSREAQRKYQRERNARVRRNWLLANGPCQKCGSTKQLEVDHIDPSTKVSHNVWSWTKQRREAELSKCQVLCHDCHVEKTSAARMPDHGSNAMYKRGCRCRPCKDAHAIVNRRYR